MNLQLETPEDKSNLRREILEGTGMVIERRAIQFKVREEVYAALEKDMEVGGRRTVTSLAKARTLDMIGLSKQALDKAKKWVFPGTKLGQIIAIVILDWCARRDAEEIEGENINIDLQNGVVNGELFESEEEYKALVRRRIEEIRRQKDDDGELRFLRWLATSLQVEESAVAYNRWLNKEITRQELGAEGARIRRKFSWKENPDWPANSGVEEGE